MAKQAKSAVATSKREAASLTASLRKLEQANTHAKSALAAAEKGLAAAKTDQARAKAESQQQKAAARAAELRTQLDTAKANAKAKLDAAAAAPGNAKAAEKRRVDTAKAALEASSRSGRSRCSSVARRRNSTFGATRMTRLPDAGERFDATIEVPITIRNPNQPIGTHVITAVASTKGRLRWTAVTIDGAGDAKDALDRITIPQEVTDRLAPTALPRSSIVISDEPLHRETNYRTEFVVALSQQPQGGLVTRPRTPPEDRIARYNGGKLGRLLRRLLWPAGAPA